MIADGISGLADAHIGQVQLRCARWNVVRVADGVWRTTRGAMATTTVGGMGSGTRFNWEVPNDVTTQNPGALRYIDFSYSFTTAGVIRTLLPYGVSPGIQ